MTPPSFSRQKSHHNSDVCRRRTRLAAGWWVKVSWEVERTVASKSGTEQPRRNYADERNSPFSSPLNQTDATSSLFRRLFFSTGVPQKRRGRILTWFRAVSINFDAEELKTRSFCDEARTRRHGRSTFDWSSFSEGLCRMQPTNEIRKMIECFNIAHQKRRTTFTSIVDNKYWNIAIVGRKTSFRDRTDDWICQNIR